MPSPTLAPEIELVRRRLDWRFGIGNEKNKRAAENVCTEWTIPGGLFSSFLLVVDDFDFTHPLFYPHLHLSQAQKVENKDNPLNTQLQDTVNPNVPPAKHVFSRLPPTVSSTKDVVKRE